MARKALKKLARILLLATVSFLSFFLLVLVCIHVPKESPESLESISAVSENIQNGEEIQVITSDESMWDSLKYPASWKFIHGKEGDRDAMIEFTNLCVDDNGKLFYHSNDSSLELNGMNGILPRSRSGFQAPPSINIAASSENHDHWIRVREDDSDGLFVEYKSNETLFVIGPTFMSHYSHFLVNNFMPLLNVLNYYYGGNWLTKSKSLYISDAVQTMPLDFRSLMGFESILSRDWRGNTTRCFKTAVIGLNSTCDCCGCVHDTYNDFPIHNQTRNLILSRFLGMDYSKFAVSALELPLSAVIVQREKSRKILNLHQVEEVFKNISIPFKTVYLEGKSLEYQTKLFSSKTIFVAVHGNALGNAFWMPPDSLVIEAWAFKQGSEWYGHIFGDSKKDFSIQHEFIKCMDQSCSDAENGEFEAGVIIDTLELTRIVNSFVAKRSVRML